MVALILITLVCLISDDLYFYVVLCEAMGRSRTIDLGFRM